MMRTAALIGLLLLSGCGAPETPEQRQAKIEAACAEQFGKGTPGDADCQLRIALKAAEKQQADRQREAERRAGQ